MGKKHILFFVDHKWRDLLSSVYIKLLLEKRGYRVTIARNGFERFILPAVQPDAVIFNHVYEDKRVDLLKRYVSDGLKVIILPTENIPVMGNVKKLFAGVMSDLSVVDSYFIWNNEVADLMKREGGFDCKRLRVIGVPRYDIYRSPLSSLIMEREEFLSKYNLEPGKPVVTMTTNFTLAGFARKNVNFFKKDINQLKSDKVGYNHDLALRDERSRTIFHETFVKLVNDYPDVNFIIKPHPSEDHMPYHEMSRQFADRSGHSRVAVVITEYIWDVLNATDILLERSCLTGLEAWIMQKPTIELHINPDEWYYSYLMAKGSNEVKTYKELSGRVDFFLSGGTIDDDKIRHRQEVIKRWCGNIDGKASLRFADNVALFLKDTPPVRKRRYFSDVKDVLLYYSFIFPDYRLLDLKLYGKPGSRIDKLGRTDKYFRKRDITYWENKMRSLL